jgi:hypothetical protein
MKQFIRLDIGGNIIARGSTSGMIPKGCIEIGSVEHERLISLGLKEASEEIGDPIIKEERRLRKELVLLEDKFLTKHRLVKIIKLLLQQVIVLSDKGSKLEDVNKELIEILNDLISFEK